MRTNLTAIYGATYSGLTWSSNRLTIPGLENPNVASPAAWAKPRERSREPIRVEVSLTAPPRKQCSKRWREIGDVSESRGVYNRIRMAHDPDCPGLSRTVQATCRRMTVREKKKLMSASGTPEWRAR